MPDGTQAYTWVEQIWDGVAGDYVDWECGRSGDVDDAPLYELNNQAITVPALVRARMRGSSGGDLVYEFEASSAGGGGGASGTITASFLDAAGTTLVDHPGVSKLVFLEAEHFRFAGESGPAGGLSVQVGHTGIVLSNLTGASPVTGRKLRINYSNAQAAGQENAALYYSAVPSSSDLNLSVKTAQGGVLDTAAGTTTAIAGVLNTSQN